MAFKNDLPTTKGLQRVYFGAFGQDPASDYVIDMAQKLNHNVIILDEALITLDSVEERVDTMQTRGMVAGLLNGGVD